MSELSSSEFVTQAEAALRRSEALKTAILETALDAIVTIDHTGRILDFNPAAERMFGYTRQEAVGQEMAEWIIPAQWRERHRMGLARAVASGQDTIVGRRIEITAIRKGGEEFPVELAITRIRGQGAPIFTGHIRDIQERKQAELQRATQLAVTRLLSEARGLVEATPQILRAVCESLHWDVGAIWRVDADNLHCVDVWHGGGEALTEFGRATRQATFVLGAGLPGRIWASGQPQWLADVTRDANFPRARLAESAGLHGAAGFPIHLGGQVLGVIEFFSREIRQPNQDVLEMFSTIGGQIGQFIERKRAELGIRQLNADLERRVAEATRGLHESQERFSKAFRASPVCLWMERQIDGRFVEVNEAFLHASGYSREEVMGRNSADLGLWSNPEDRGAFIREVQHRGFIRDREMLWRSKKGRLDTMLLSAELIEIDAEAHVLMVGLDITSRKKAEEDMRRALEQAEELSRLKTNFVTLVSHEFRTPLGIIMSSADILRKYFDRLSSDRRAEHLQDIHNATGRMAELMDEVLLLAQFEADKVECKPLPLDLRTFCLRLAEEIRSSTNAACAIQVAVSPLNGPAAADQALLRHIFTNLLSNAVKYSTLGSTVELQLDQCDGEAIFQVRDRGIGIPEEDLAQLFQSFRRGGNLGEQPGSGLGLFIVKRCVELHRGTIQLSSREGEGTTVSNRLPLFSKAITPVSGASPRGRAQRSPSRKRPAPAPRKRKAKS